MKYERVIQHLQSQRDALAYTAAAVHESDAAQKYPEVDVKFQEHWREEIAEYDSVIALLQVEGEGK